MPTPQEVQPFLEEMHAARWYSNFGPLNKRFENAMASFLAPSAPDDIHVVTFTSATTALEAALHVMDLPAGGRVLVPALTFPATATAVIRAGLVPVFSDVDEASWEMLPRHARKALEEGDICAVMPVSAYGKPISVAAWDSFSQETGIPVIADSAAALGQQEIGKSIHLAFSLHATKPFSVGEGGLLVTPDAALADRARSWSNFGFKGPGGAVSQVGTNAKMGEFYAATGLAQLARWPEVCARRQQVLDWYNKALEGLGNAIVRQASEQAFVPATFVIKTQGKANAVATAMAENAIHTRFWYLPPLYEHPALKHLAEGLDPAKAFPITNALKADLIGLPFHGSLSQQDVQEVSRVLAEVV